MNQIDNIDKPTDDNMKEVIPDLDPLVPGMIVDCQIYDRLKHGYKITILKYDVIANLPKLHLSDSPTKSAELWKYLKKDTILKNCMCLELGSTVTVTRKNLLILQEKGIFQNLTFDDIKIGLRLFGVIHNIKPSGLVVLLKNNLEGFVPLKYLPPKVLSNLKNLKVNMTVEVIVVSIKQQSKKLICSMIVKNTVKTKILHLKSLLEEQKFIFKLLNDQNGSIFSYSRQIGSIINLKITGIHYNHISGITQDGIIGYIPRYHMKDFSGTIHDEVSAFVLHIDLEKGHLVLSVKKNLFIKKKKLKLCRGEIFQANVVYFDADLIMVFIEDVKQSFLAYMPVKRCCHDYWGSKRFTLGQKVNVKIKRICDDYILVSSVKKLQNEESKELFVPLIISKNKIVKRPHIEDSFSEANISRNSVKRKLKKSKTEESFIQKKLREKKNANKPCLEIKEDFEWDNPFKLTDLQQIQPADSSSSSEEEEETKPLIIPKKRNRLGQKLEAEKALYELEKALMDEERPPETVDDFDRLILASPNSSLIWLRFMAYYLQFAEVDKARAVGERALKTISFREEQEKFNVWIALLNLENMYGTSESLAEIFRRAIEQNDPLKVHQQLANLYIKSEKFELAEHLYLTMIRKFNRDPMVWLNFALFYMKNGRKNSARKLLDRSLKSLEPKTHVNFLAKFAHMEFLHGEPERGMTMFENILATYQKRTDLWSVYIDVLIKSKDYTTTRKVFDRAITLDMNLKKKKFFFKKFLQFEKEHGDDVTIANVKLKIQQFMESDVL